MQPQFTYQYLQDQFEDVISHGYVVMTCKEYAYAKIANRLPEKVLVNRVDIDFTMNKTERLIDIFHALRIKGTFFLRLHAPEYNPFSFENYRVIKKLIDSGHELGYHSEVVDEAAIWNESAEACLIRDIETMNTMFSTKICGVASHGSRSGLNNLDFWKDRSPAELGLLYEGYDTKPRFDLYNNSIYVSDSEWHRWKCYDHGVLVEGDRRDLAQHAAAGHPLIYSLIHPDTYFDRHCYE